MIKSFSTLYAGHVLEGDGVGFAGTPANDRWYPNDRLAQAFAIAKETARFTEELGYDVIWMAEHHFQREGYECIPNILMLSLWLAPHTKKIKFGCAFNILPMGASTAQFREQVTRFAQEVMPAFKPERVKA